MSDSPHRVFVPESSEKQRLYGELASWWYLLSPISEYEAEAAEHTRLLACDNEPPLPTLLELGSGGGNNAWYMKRHFEITLVDHSASMIAQSLSVNPECAHIVGDMRTARLGREFDRVFIHDAICYMATEADLQAAVETAFVHCKPGGSALFAPDHLRETFTESTGHGGSDGERRALRYLEWTYDPDPSDTTYVVDYLYALRHEDGSLDTVHDRHTEGLFARSDWVRILEGAGFEVQIVPAVGSGDERIPERFLTRRPLAHV